MFTHRVRLLLIGAFLTVALAATLLLEAPEATRTVDEVMELSLIHISEPTRHA